MVAAEAFARLKTGPEKTGCKEWQRRRGCCDGDLVGGNDEEGSAGLETDNHGQEIAGLVDCALAAVVEATGQHVLCSCFEPRSIRQTGRLPWLERSRWGSLLIALGVDGRSSTQIGCGSRR